MTIYHFLKIVTYYRQNTFRSSKVSHIFDFVAFGKRHKLLKPCCTLMVKELDKNINTEGKSILQHVEVDSVPQKRENSLNCIILVTQL